MICLQFKRALGIQESKIVDFELTRLIISALTGLLAGAVGSLIAPWVHWRIEKVRKSIEYKQALIKDVRHLLDQAESMEAILSSSLWGFIYGNLDKNEKRSITSPNGLNFNEWPDMDDLSVRKQLIGDMLYRLEERMYS